MRSDLGHWPLATTTAHAHTVDHKALLGLVAHAARLVGARRLGQAHDAGQLPELPAAHAQQEAEHIALLLAPQLLDVLLLWWVKRDGGGESGDGDAKAAAAFWGGSPLCLATHDNQCELCNIICGTAESELQRVCTHHTRRAAVLLAACCCTCCCTAAAFLPLPSSCTARLHELLC